MLTAVRTVRQHSVARQVLIVLAFFAAVWGFLAVAAERHGFFDLRVYYGALNYWMHSGGQLYDYLLPRTEYGFTYPPFAALMMLPMSFLGWNVTIAISLAMTVTVSILMAYWFVGPIARRQGWTMGFAIAIALGFAAAFEPIRETVSFGQVNLLLMFLVTADVLFLIGPGRRWGGIGIGLATAIKLTPGIFILYLLVTRRWRAAAVASATAAAATWLAATFAPDASRVFWTDAVWNTDRVGNTAFVSNQSLMGLVSRFNPAEPSKVLWLLLLLGALAVWAWRARQAILAKDEIAGLVLTGIAGCLVSPITWIHHLVWVAPAIVILLDHALDATRDKRERRTFLIFAILVFGIMSSRLVWAFHKHFHDYGVLGSNAYVLILVILLFTIPIRTAVPGASQVPGSARPTAENVPDLVEIDRRVTAAFNAKDAGLDVDDDSDTLAETARPLVGARHP